MRVASRRPGYVIGYHGTSLAIARSVVLREQDLVPSTNDYDWLGVGIYFWEGSYQRAEEWAIEKKYPDPCVLGAVISLGHCLDLLDQECLDHVVASLEKLRATLAADEQVMPVNLGRRRELDCAVINLAVAEPPPRRSEPFDSVRAAFMEGYRIAQDSGFHQRSHIQIAVHNPNCIKGYFLPLAGDMQRQSV